MKCPVCDARLREVTRRGVEIDICPECKGVWLERGELEKLIEVAAEEEDYVGERSGRPRDRDDDDDERERHRRYEEEWRRKPEAYRTQKKKSSWLSQVLESVGGEGND
ncbi:MAG: cytoplasmic protein [Chloroflexi bacterium]|nr:MAG: cytoplasmic protein [Chloroflexota bacterium]